MTEEQLTAWQTRIEARERDVAAKEQALLGLAKEVQDREQAVTEREQALTEKAPEKASGGKPYGNLTEDQIKKLGDPDFFFNMVNNEPRLHKRPQRTESYRSLMEVLPWWIASGAIVCTITTIFMMFVILLR